MSLERGLVEIDVREAESVKDRLIRPMQGHKFSACPGEEHPSRPGFRVGVQNSGVIP